MPEPCTSEFNRLYGELAWLWPHLSPPEDYAAEAEAIHLAVTTYQPAPAEQTQHLLELGAGGGHTLYHLKHEYDCTAVDISPAMLEQCAALNPEVACIQGDMRSLNLKKQYDIVLIHDAIDYMLTEPDVQAAIHTAAKLLKPAGLLLVAPTYFKETFVCHELETDQQPLDEERYLSYVQYIHDPNPSDTQFQLTLIYLISEAGKLRIEHDHHICGLFSEAFWKTTLQDAGFTLLDQSTSETPWHLLAGRKNDQ